MKRLGNARALTAALIMCGLLLAACGGGETSTAAADSVADGGAAAPSPEDVAEQNLPNLQTADDARDIEMLTVSDGSVATLRDVVDGDRPVLLWFWAPH